MRIFFGIGLFLPFLGNAQSNSIEDTMLVHQSYINVCCITFEFNKAILKEESFIHLDSVVGYFEKHKSTVVEVENHCDTRSNIDDYGKGLTHKRAQAVVDYFISKGIDKRRVFGTGYGDTKPIISDSEILSLKTKEEKEAAHAKNRRTEFKVIRIDYKE